MENRVQLNWRNQNVEKLGSRDILNAFVQGQPEH